MGGKVSVGQIDINREAATMVELHDDRVPVTLFEETERDANDKADRMLQMLVQRITADG